MKFLYLHRYIVKSQKPEINHYESLQNSTVRSLHVHSYMYAIVEVE